MARECCQCKYHKNVVWYIYNMELATDKCTLGLLYDADDCPYFEEISYEDIDYEEEEP